MPEWLKKLFGIEDGPVGFVPTYQPQQYVYVTNNSGSLDRYPLNTFYFVSQESADVLASKYGGKIVPVPYLGSGGPMKSDAKELWIVFPNGKSMNAGFLAAYYTNNPESKFPGLADQLCRTAIDNASIQPLVA